MQYVGTGRTRRKPKRRVSPPRLFALDVDGGNGPTGEL